MAEVWSVTKTSNIAVIDDDPGVRCAVEDLLRSSGYQTRALGNAAKFLRSTYISYCDCIVSDFQMPDTNGLDLLRTLRLRGIDTPVIIISALMANTVQVEIAKASAFDFVEKPFAPDTFLEAVHSAVANSAKWNHTCREQLADPAPSP